VPSKEQKRDQAEKSFSTYSKPPSTSSAVHRVHEKWICKALSNLKLWIKRTSQQLVIPYGNSRVVELVVSWQGKTGKKNSG